MVPPCAIPSRLSLRPRGQRQPSQRLEVCAHGVNPRSITSIGNARSFGKFLVDWQYDTSVECLWVEGSSQPKEVMVDGSKITSFRMEAD